MEKENNSIGSSIAPISRETIVRPEPKCDCKKEQEEAELQSIISYYQTAVNNARSTGYQAANDPGYSDPGLGLHKVGNCADWARVSWGALVVWKWKCWNIHMIRARKHWTLLTFHHFVEIESTCETRAMRSLFLDPWKTGKPDFWPSKDFPFADGVDWSHTRIIIHAAGDKVRDPVND